MKAAKTHGASSQPLGTRKESPRPVCDGSWGALLASLATVPAGRAKNDLNMWLIHTETGPDHAAAVCKLCQSGM